jgi:hypothetical protein
VNPLCDLLAPSLLSLLKGGSAPKTTPEWDSIGAAAGWLSFLSYLVGVVAAIGLLLLKRWARPLALAAAFAVLIFFLPFGEVSHSGKGFASALAALDCGARRLHWLNTPKSVDSLPCPLTNVWSGRES